MKTQRFLSVLGILLFVPIATAAEWKAGLAKTVITPPRPVFMSGYASRNKPSQGVVHHIYAKALALTDSKGHRAVLITSDLIGFRAAVGDPICERIMTATGLQRSQIILSSSHTHTGPSQTVKVEASGNMSADDAQELFDYTEWMQARVVEVAIAALKDQQPVTLAQGVGLARFVMNRREATPRGIVLGFNPRGPADRSVPLLRIAAEDGKLLAVLFQAGAHNTTLGGKHYDICGDYAGFAQAHVERELPGVQAMFMLGCAGDANPHPRGTLAAARENGRELGAEVLRLLDGKLRPVKGPLKTVYAKTDLPLQPLMSEKQVESFLRQGGGWRRWVAGKMLESHGKGEKGLGHYAAPFSLWQFGSDLTLVGLSGEVVVDYVYRLEKELGPLNLWVAAYCNDVYGYLPSARILAEGGYETRGIYSGGIGLFKPEAEAVVVEAIRKLAEKAGRSLP
jgi:neutral ceramidase